VREWAPQLVTLRLRDGLPSLRERGAWRVVVRTMKRFRGRFAVRIVHYSVLRNHLHMITEGRDRESFARGIKALGVRLAKQLNKYFDRRGALLASRFHSRELGTPREVWLALRYVLLNARKHAREAGVTLPRDWIDPRSTAVTFDGWTTPLAISERAEDLGTEPPQSWLLRIGWRRHGLIAIDDVPGHRRSPRGSACHVQT